MKTDFDDNEWKAEAPYLARLPKINPFVVPEHYFDTLPDHIASAIYVNEMAENNTVTGFTVPDDYFSSLKDRIIAQTSEDKLAELPPDTGFSTPDHYFQQLQAKILSKTTEARNDDEPPVVVAKAPSKIVRLWHSGVLKYASAACFILVAAFGFYLNEQVYQSKPSAAEIANEQLLFDIDEQDIIEHVEGTMGDESKNTAYTEELENYILTNYSQSDLSSGI